MVRKSADEVLSSYTSEELIQRLVRQLEAVGIPYKINPNGSKSKYIPISPEDTIGLSYDDFLNEEEEIYDNENYAGMIEIDSTRSICFFYSDSVPVNVA